MKTSDIIKGINLSKDLISVFKDYTTSLDEYFKIKENIEEHPELYEMYIKLNEKIEFLKDKYKLWNFLNY